MTIVSIVSIILLKQKFFVTLEDVFSDADAGIMNCDVSQGLWGLLLCLIYSSDLPQTLNETGSYFHAGYTCIVYQDKDVKK